MHFNFHYYINIMQLYVTCIYTKVMLIAATVYGRSYEIAKMSMITQD